MHFTDRIRTVNCVYDPYKPYGSTNRCDPFAQKKSDIYSRLPSEMRFSDRIRTENCVYDPYKLYGSQTVVTLLSSNTCFILMYH